MKCEHEWEIIDQFNENVVYCKCSLCNEESHFLKQMAKTTNGSSFER